MTPAAWFVLGVLFGALLALGGRFVQLLSRHVAHRNRQFCGNRYCPVCTARARGIR